MAHEGLTHLCGVWREQHVAEVRWDEVRSAVVRCLQVQQVLIKTKRVNSCTIVDMCKNMCYNVL